MDQPDTAAPPCPPQPAHQTRSTRLLVPPGAVDTHCHVIGQPPEYPFMPNRSYTPTEATPEQYIRMLDETGMTHGVLVQVSVHGSDNRLMVKALRAHRERLRGVAVMPLGLPEAEYVAMKEVGVEGLRLNGLYGGGIGFEDLRDYGALAREMGWHLQFLIGLDQLVTIARELGRLPVPVIIDHMAHFPVAETAVDDPKFQTLVSLVRDGGWVKLSGAYRLSSKPAPYVDTVPYAQALLAVAPTRCVWGSDWPHVAHHRPMMGVADLLDTLALWAPSAEAQKAVLVDNPAAFYGFPGGRA